MYDDKLSYFEAIPIGIVYKHMCSVYCAYMNTYIKVRMRSIVSAAV